MTKIFVLREFNERQVKIKGANFILRQHASTEMEDRVSVDFLDLTPLVAPLDLDLAYIASSFFVSESLQRIGKINLDEWICFLVRRINVWNKPEIKHILQDILSFMIKSKPIIRFKRAPRKRRSIQRKLKLKDVESVTLFSGGIDSFSGILNVHLTHGPTAGVFVSHVNLGAKVDNITNNFLQEYGIQTYRVNVQCQKGVLQQLRGFLYLALSVVLARILNTNKIFISETGPIMYQPRLAPMDEVTLTTYPTLIKLSKELFREIYDIEFEFYEPFEDLTKAEVIAICPKKEAIPFTNSCISTRFAYFEFSHCGRCYGCLVRRLSCLVAGVTDAKYGRDILLQEIGERKQGGWPGKWINYSDFDDLYVLLRFVRDILEDQLPDFTAFKIKEFGKEELFRRFALDIFAGLFILYDQQKVGRNSYIRNFYEECKEDGIISKEVLEDRINEVREGKYKPNFSFKL